LSYCYAYTIGLKKYVKPNSCRSDYGPGDVRRLRGWVHRHRLPRQESDRDREDTDAASRSKTVAATATATVKTHWNATGTEPKTPRGWPW